MDRAWYKSAGIKAANMEISKVLNSFWKGLDQFVVLSTHPRSSDMEELRPRDWPMGKQNVTHWASDSKEGAWESTDFMEQTKIPLPR